MKYPRLCAHKGFHSIAPENSLLAFGAAVALGAEEIRFDLWATKDGVLVCCSDDMPEKVSNENKKICEHTYKELSEWDFGMPYGEQFKGGIPTFEESLQKFAGRVIMNIHAKTWNKNTDTSMIEESVALIRKYDCEKHVYFTTANDEMIRRVMKYAPHLKCCVGWNGDPMSTVDRAIALGAYKIQLCKPYFNRETI